ncbi:MAG: pro-sigmaK processing inhibitor BofA family protein [Clostridia bacterium]|nr:pro-sigmaK processing inhibitor BofA family protein [Clostridia bacterium]
MDIDSIIIYSACIIVVIIVGKVFALPLKKVVKLLLNSALGGILIYIINVVGSSFNFHIGLNIGTVIFAGILGVPGVVLLVALKLIL